MQVKKNLTVGFQSTVYLSLKDTGVSLKPRLTKQTNQSLFEVFQITLSQLEESTKTVDEPSVFIT